MDALRLGCRRGGRLLKTVHLSLDDVCDLRLSCIDSFLRAGNVTGPDTTLNPIRPHTM